MKFSELALVAAGALAMTAQAETAPANPADYKTTVLITGSNRGIGFEFVRRFSERDWRIIATAQHQRRALVGHRRLVNYTN